MLGERSATAHPETPTVKTTVATKRDSFDSAACISAPI
jgi:hypothetical protein